MEWISGNVFIRPNKLANKGEKISGHRHQFDHTTIVFKGGIHVKGTLPNGSIIERDFVAPAHCLIRADVEHEITALQDDTEYWCVYAHHTPQGDVVQEYTGWGYV
jgi:hypothetical protein